MNPRAEKYIQDHRLVGRIVTVGLGDDGSRPLGRVDAVYLHEDGLTTRAEVTLEPGFRDGAGDEIVAADVPLDACRPLLTYVGRGPVPLTLGL